MSFRFNDNVKVLVLLNMVKAHFHKFGCLILFSPHIWIIWCVLKEEIHHRSDSSLNLFKCSSFFTYFFIQNIPGVIKMFLFSSFVQLEDVTSNLAIINKKSYKTAREVFTHCSTSDHNHTETEMIKHFLH